MFCQFHRTASAALVLLNHQVSVISAATLCLNVGPVDPIPVPPSPQSAAIEDGRSIANAFEKVSSGKLTNFINFNGLEDPCGAALCYDPIIHYMLPGWEGVDQNTPKCNWPVVACLNYRVAQISLYDTNLGQVQSYAAPMTGLLEPSRLPNQLQVFAIRTMPKWTDNVVLSDFPMSLLFLDLEHVGWGGSSLQNIFQGRENTLAGLRLWETQHSGPLPSMPLGPTQTVGSITIHVSSLSVYQIYFMPNIDEGPFPEMHWHNQSYQYLYFLELSYTKRRGGFNLHGMADSAVQLMSLGLSGNNFEGTPASDILVTMPLGMTQLTAMGSGLTGAIDWNAIFVTAITYPLIATINLAYNKLSGTIPFSTFPTRFPAAKLSHFDVSHNEFTSTDTTIDLSSDRFIGTTEAKYWDLSYNKFSFNTFVWADIGKLQHFGCAKCGLSGVFDHNDLGYGLTTRSPMIHLNLDDNAFTQYKPSGAVRVPTITSVAGNGITGTFPWADLVAIDLGTLPNQLNIERNNYTGTIDWGHVFGLDRGNEKYRIELDHNQFDGTVNWTAFSQISTAALKTEPHLSAHHNKLTGSVDFEVFRGWNNAQSLHAIRINNNMFDSVLTADSLKPLGSITRSTGSVSELRELDISQNLLTGTIDLDVSHLPRLYRFRALQATNDSCSMWFVNQNSFLQRFDGSNTAASIDWTNATLIDPEMVRDTDITRSYLEQWNTTCNPTPAPTPVPPATPAPGSSGSSSDDTPVGAIVGGVLGGLCCCGLLAALAFLLLKKRDDKPNERSVEEENTTQTQYVEMDNQQAQQGQLAYYQVQEGGNEVDL